ncbi:MAG: MBL fold metallo-hydrolase [Caldilineaceae bacterium]|nr:MBL fold metallo-hydrolase [Caldilineaceae bacterium]
MHQFSNITYIGHATLLIETNGVRLLTDPILSHRISGFLRRHHLIPRAGEVGEIDAVLLSHMHHDHLHIPSLELVGRQTRIIAPAGTAAFLRRKGFRHVTELVVGQRTWVGAVSIEATYAVHAGRRPPFGPTADCIGFLIDGAYRVYFAGDTDLFPDMEQVGSELDLALLPVWGWGPTLGTGHMDPARAAEALTLLQPRMAIPIHWGTLHPLGMGWWQPNFLTSPPERFREHARTLAPDVDVHIVAPGQGVDLAYLHHLNGLPSA